MSEFFNAAFIAKLIDFVLFIAFIWWAYVKWGQPALVAHQEAQNRAVEEAERKREEAGAALERAREYLDNGGRDAVRMVEVARLQAERLLTEERAHAEERAKRVLGHARGELERERYRQRRELLIGTVERAYAAARDLARRELDADAQARLIERLVTELEARARA